MSGVAAQDEGAEAIRIRSGEKSHVEADNHSHSHTHSHTDSSFSQNGAMQ
eukprot:COSAG06_NODE_439_length_15765_cov_69.583812_15_plen_49_part_01